MSIHIFNDLSEHLRIRMKSIAHKVNDAEWVESKAHMDYDLWLLKRGSVRIRIGDEEHSAANGDVVFFYPGVAYTAWTEGEGNEFIYIHFDFELGDQPRFLNEFPLSGVVRKPYIDREAGLFRKAYSHYETTSAPGSLYYLTGCLTMLLSKIIELHGINQYEGSFPANSSKRQLRSSITVLQPVLNYIYENLHRPLRINELSALAGMSDKYFITYFKQTLGLTPHRYILQIKMNKARDLLYKMELSIQEIADRIGYSDPFSFSKAFKKYYGVAPSKFE